MRFLVLSDSHRQEKIIENILRYETANPSRRPDYLLFLGDGIEDFAALTDYGEFSTYPALAVRGNCDFFSASDLPELRTFTLAERRIMMCHGHRYGVKSGTDVLAAIAVSGKADLVLFGHTHTPYARCYEVGETVGGVRLEKPMTLFNPGSVSCGCYGVITVSEKGIFCEHKQK